MKKELTLYKIGGSQGIVIPRLYFDFIGFKEGERIEIEERRINGSKKLILSKK